MDTTSPAPPPLISEHPHVDLLQQHIYEYYQHNESSSALSLQFLTSNSLTTTVDGDDEFDPEDLQNSSPPDPVPFLPQTPQLRTVNSASNRLPSRAAGAIRRTISQLDEDYLDTHADQIRKEEDDNLLHSQEH
jgi:hypothetical protein